MRVKFHGTAIALAALIGTQAAHAQSAPPEPASVTAVKVARMLDVATGRYVPDAVVLIQGEKITAAGSNLAIPAGASVIDLGDATLLPGLIDAHTHLMARMSGKDGDYVEALATRSIARRTLEGAADARATLRAGFTSVRDVESEGTGYADLDLRDAIRAGLVEGPRMQAASRAIAMVGQYNPFGVSWDLRDFPTGAQMVSGVEEARRAAREQLGHGASLLKVYADWQYPTLSVEEIRAVVEEAHRAHRKVAAHATTPEGIQNAVDAGVDSIEHGFDMTEANLRAMKAKGVTWVPTIGYFYRQVQIETDPEARAYFAEKIKKVRANLALAQQLGVRIANGFDPSTEEAHGRNVRELEATSALGLGPLGAIRSATTSAAELMGWEKNVGALTPGHYADLIAVRGDPLADIAVLGKVAFVMKGGAVVRDDLHQTHREQAP